MRQKMTSSPVPSWKKGFRRAVTNLKKRELKRVIENGKNVGIKKEDLYSIELILQDKLELSDLTKDEGMFFAEEMRKIIKRFSRAKKWKRKFKLSGKKKTPPKKSESLLYGGGTVFDGDRRKPINRQASKGLT